MSETADLYRMVMKDHLCPYGLKSRDLLRRKGFHIEDHPLTSREEAERFKQQQQVDTTPQTFIDNKRIGGYDELREYFGKSIDKTETTYTPVIVIFLTTLLMATALSWNGFGEIFNIWAVETFVALSMCVLAVQKLILSLHTQAQNTEQNQSNTNFAIFAGGCFWCMGPPFDALDGVISTVSGYISVAGTKTQTTSKYQAATPII